MIALVLAAIGAVFGLIAALNADARFAGVGVILSGLAVLLPHL
jgi:hypothetical protein